VRLEVIREGSHAWREFSSTRKHEAHGNRRAPPIRQELNKAAGEYLIAAEVSGDDADAGAISYEAMDRKSFIDTHARHGVDPDRLAAALEDPRSRSAGRTRHLHDVVLNQV
jgi:hypothetical protein